VVLSNKPPGSRRRIRNFDALTAAARAEVERDARVAGVVALPEGFRDMTANATAELLSHASVFVGTVGGGSMVQMLMVNGSTTMLPQFLAGWSPPRHHDFENEAVFSRIPFNRLVVLNSTAVWPEGTPATIRGSEADRTVPCDVNVNVAQFTLELRTALDRFHAP
jgi:hypothetical protein